MKPPTPFPLHINIGTDIVHLPRIARLVSQPNGYLTRFTKRILNESEQADFRRRFNLPPGSDVPLESRLYPTHRRFDVPATTTPTTQMATAAGVGAGTRNGLDSEVVNVNTGGNGNGSGNALGSANASGNPRIGGSVTGISSGTSRTSSSLNVEMARWLAGRFAAKEAARKAAPGGAAAVGWHDVMVTRGENDHVEGQEQGNISAAAKKRKSDSESGPLGPGQGLGQAVVGEFRRRRRDNSGRPEIVYLDPEGGPGRMGKLSISHDGEYVVATVFAAG